MIGCFLLVSPPSWIISFRLMALPAATVTVIVARFFMLLAPVREANHMTLFPSLLGRAILTWS